MHEPTVAKRPRSIQVAFPINPPIVLAFSSASPVFTSRIQPSSFCPSFARRRVILPPLPRAHCVDVEHLKPYSPPSAVSSLSSQDASISSDPLLSTSSHLIRVEESAPSPQARNSEPSKPSVPQSQTNDASTQKKPKSGRNKPRTLETRRKISYSLLGRPKSEEMRAKLSEKMKGRIPWNKGKKMSPETRARMSAASVGRLAWNKGRRLSKAHRVAISANSSRAARKLSEDTRARMRMARRRPGDAVVAGSPAGAIRPKTGSYRLVDGADINAYVSLRRELRVWSDSFTTRNARRPTLADVRRLAPVPIIRKFEKYVVMRDQIRGLAGDVYGGVDPTSVPGVSTRDLSSTPCNNNSDMKIVVTKHGNRRMVSGSGIVGAESIGYGEGDAELEGSLEDMWDMYDRPSSWEQRASTESDNSLIGTHVLYKKSQHVSRHLSANDFRKIGRYRLMETMDINRYVELRKELQTWSADFKRKYGRTPSLSDANNGGTMWYTKFCDYLDMRDKMEGLVEEVYGTKVDDLETLKKVNAEGKKMLNTLLGTKSSGEGDESTSSGSYPTFPSSKEM